MQNCNNSQNINHPNILLGIGNDLLGDDGVGPYISKNLNDSAWETFDGGILPENLISPILRRNPYITILVDAVEMGLSTGTTRVIPVQYIHDLGVGSHQIPLTYLIGRLSAESRRVILIGIQPGSLIPDTMLSEPVKNAADNLMKLLVSGRIDDVPVLILNHDNAEE
jgi:hydrogenase 3 maturation protease